MRFRSHTSRSVAAVLAMAGFVSLSAFGAQAGDSLALVDGLSTTVPTSAEPQSDQAVEASDVAGEAEEATPPGATEVDEAMPRLAVADADSGSVEILDLVTGEAIASFEATGPASLASDGRFVFATDYEGGSVTVIDSGSWVIDHGEHAHAYIADPALLGALEGDHPAHVVSNEGFTAVFFDGTGTAEVLHEDALGQGSIEPELTFETSPHHGVVMAFADHFAVSIPGPTPEDLPVGVEVRHGDGDVEETFAECPELHGEAGFADGVLLACADGVLWVTGGEGGWDAQKLAYPEGATAGDRTWTFVHTHGVPVAAGALGDDALLVFDTATAEMQRIDLPSAPVTLAVVNDGEALVALTDDGQLHLIDVAAGEIVSSGPVTGAVDLESEDGPPVPAIAIAGGRAYVSNAAAATVIEIDFNDGMRVARTFEFEITPARLAVTGTR